MKSTRIITSAAALASCSTGVFLALVATASPAGADPVDPSVPPAPAIAIQAAGTDAPVLPPNGIPHLTSPDAPPPGTTADPSVLGADDPNTSYIKDLWHAVQNQEISGGEALMLGLAQRSMNTPYPDQAPGPTVPTSPGDPALLQPGPVPPTP